MFALRAARPLLEAFYAPLLSPNQLRIILDARVRVTAEVTDIRRKLLVMRRDGFVLKELSLSTPPDDGVVASWRKYQHR